MVRLRLLTRRRGRAMCMPALGRCVAYVRCTAPEIVSERVSSLSLPLALCSLSLVEISLSQIISIFLYAFTHTLSFSLALVIMMPNPLDMEAALPFDALARHRRL